MIAQLLRILRESIKAVPAMRYALAVAGILAVVAMVGTFQLSPQTAVFGAVITLVLMVAMVIFARLTTTAPRHFILPVQLMTWAFLIVTVATAFLLFTSAFFQWPRGLRDLLDAKPVAPAVRKEAAEVKNLVSAARQQRTGRDYAGAWQTIGRALAAAPESAAAREEQLEIAMVWVREMTVRAPETFATAVRPLLECLYLNATTAQGIRAADIHAHIGWANFLRFRETNEDLKIQEEYATAVALDGTNPFANAMWGHWLATRRRPLEEVKARFRLALSTARERAFVQHIRIAALDWLRTPASALEMIRMADEMRRNHEDLPSDDRGRVYSAAYVYVGRDDGSALLEVLPPKDHLATFRWLVEGSDIRGSAVKSYYLARLSEAAGDYAAAVAGYRELLKEDTTYNDKAKAGLARCEHLIAKSNSGDRD